MAADIDICNMALSHLGSDAIITSINPADGTVEAGLCVRFYPQARTELIESFSWPFAKKRVALAAVDNPSTVWSYAFALPADCLNPVRVLNTYTLLDFGFLPIYGWVTPSELVLFNERGTADFEIEGVAVLTDQPDAVLLYTADVIDTSKFTPTFTAALSYLLTAYLAGPIIKGTEGAKAALQFRQIAMKIAGEAIAIEANNSAEPATQIPDSIRARS